MVRLLPKLRSVKGREMNKIVLVVVAHPDDETLGMGGTIARHSAQGDQVHLLCLSNGVGARGADSEAAQKRQQDARKATEKLGVSSTCFLEFPDNAFDGIPLLEIIKAIEAERGKYAPTIVYTHHGSDLNIDHRLTCQAVLTAFRPQPGESCREILAFEVNSSTEWATSVLGTPFAPDTYVDVSAYRSCVLEAYQCYGEEVRPDPHARSVKALEVSLQHRGREVGLSEAEAFVTLRRLI